MTHPTNRRKFIQQTSAIAGAAAFPYLISSQRARAEAANDKLNVAAIGVGARGSSIGRQAGRLGNMVACADVIDEHAEKFAAEHQGKCKIYTDYREILNRQDVDAITCGTPDHWHTKIAIDAMRAGKDVYCEKPLTLTMEESRQIMEATKETGRVFQVGTQQRSEHNQMFLKAIAIVQSGRLGENLHATCGVGEGQYGGPFPWQDAPKGLNWDMWLGQAPKVGYCPERCVFDFRWWLEYSGGQITDWGVHHTDIAIWALGGAETGVSEIEGTGTFPGLSHTINILDVLNGRATMPNCNSVATSFQCQMKLANGNTIELNSGENEIIFAGDNGKIRVNRRSLTGKPIEEIAASPADSQKLDEQVQKLYRGMPFDSHMNNFFHCVKSRELPISDVWSHANSVNACHMANIAMLLKRRLTFDHAAYQFVGDDEANQFMSREQRSPWQT